MADEKFMKWAIVILVALLVLSLIHNYRKFNNHKDEKKIKIDFNVKLPKENYYGMDYENYTGAF